MEEYNREFTLLKDKTGFTNEGRPIEICKGEIFISTHRHFDEGSRNSLLYGHIMDKTGSHQVIWISKQDLRMTEKESITENLYRKENEYETLETLERHIIKSLNPEFREGKYLTPTNQDNKNTFKTGDLVEAKFDFDDKTLANGLVTKAHHIIEVIEEQGDWILGLNELGYEGLLPKLYVESLDLTTDEVAVQTANNFEDKLRATPQETENKGDLECRLDGQKSIQILSLKQMCSHVLLDIEKDSVEPDILNIKVLEDISRHCSKRFSRLLLLRSQTFYGGKISS